MHFDVYSEISRVGVLALSVAEGPNVEFVGYIAFLCQCLRVSARNSPRHSAH